MTDKTFSQTHENDHNADIKMESFTVHAWCDLVPYGGGA